MACAILDSVGLLAELVVAGRDFTLLLVLAASLVASNSVRAESLGPESLKLDEERLQPGLYPGSPETISTTAPAEPAHRPFHLDWSLGLRGTYTASSTEDSRFVTTLNPTANATFEGRRSDLVLSGDAEIARPWTGSETIGVTALRLGAAGTLALDSATRLRAGGSFSLQQPLASAPGLNPQIVTPPQTLSGSASAGIDRQFGKVNLSLDGSLTRTVYGPTDRIDTGLTENSDQNLWQADAKLRTGIQITPIIEVFGEAEIGRDMFDVASTALGTKADATSKSLRGGVAGSWNGVWRASASVGVGHYDFDAAGLADITTSLYDASLTYSPNAAVNVTASLSTSVEPTGADAQGTARVTHIAEAKLDYTVNSWLRLRASADWGLSTLEGNGETERRNGLGAGADYLVNAHTALTADYGYSHRDNSTSGVTDNHSVTFGITLRR